MADPIFAGSKPDDETVPDYLGRDVKPSFKGQPALPSAGPAVGVSAGPSTLAGGGVKGANVGGGTGSSGSPAGGGTPGTPGPSTLAQIAKALGLSADALKVADVAKKQFGGGTEGVSGAGAINPQVAAGDQAVAAGNAFPGETMGELSVSSSAGAENAAGGLDSGAGFPGPAAAVARAGLGAYNYYNSKLPDEEKALLALHDAGMLVADAYTFGLAELGPQIGNALGKDNILGKILMGAPAFLGGPSHYGAVRGRAGREAGLESAGLSKAYQQAAESHDLPTMQRALQQEEGQHVRSDLYLSPETAKELGLPAGYNHWGGLTDDQFGKMLDLYAANPQAIELRGSGDVGYLPQGPAQQVANNASTSTHHFLDYAAQVRALQKAQAAAPQEPSRDQTMEALKAMGLRAGREPDPSQPANPLPGGGGATAAREGLGLETA